MKKLIMIGALAAIVVTSCRKRDENVSHLVDPSYPTVTLTGEQYYSINVGGAAPTIAATAYDSVLNEVDETSYDASVIDANTPGLYVVPITARNSNGYIGSVTVYVAVTDIPDAVDQSGTFERAATGGIANITKVSRGLYETDNVGGNAGASTHALFVQTSPTECIIPTQLTTDGDMAFPTATFTFDGTGLLTDYTYTIDNGGYGKAARSFSRQ